ncbi:uncharacterized protein LOC131668284 isoform X2 [Phymastichus coffea]|uniref:uncharacterized protein LOC131668284 isoform X2 n=1 Tax=Phymastichus coffea TaxID=108790 RepID=UPI00273BE161|nr:uncharacterized protein LOC131668284 isoform X2 [Phymastichus coffea]
MAGQPTTACLFTALALLLCAVTQAIQNNEPTHWRSSGDDPTVAAAAASTPLRTSEHEPQGPVWSLRRTRDHAAPTLRLESSRGSSSSSDDPDELESAAETRLHSEQSSSLADDSLDAALSSSAKIVDHIDDLGNQIEVKAGDYYRNIVPTKSESLSGEGQGAPGGQQPSSPSSEPREQREGASQASTAQPRQARREPARIFSEHAPPPVLSQAEPPASQQRQANPDIQDIITGIVKLLNGKVNVAVSSVKPVRAPQSTRINNRGPPRISDVVPLPPDFDTPGMNPPPAPLPEQPSTFETPPSPSPPSLDQLPPEPTPFLDGLGQPEPIVPPPAHRPWNRPKRPGMRRPIPAYKPLPSANASASASPDREQQSESNAVLDVGNKIELDQLNRTSRPTVSPTRKYQSTLKTDQSIAEDVLILGGLPPLALPIPNATDHSYEQGEPEPVVPLNSITDNDKISLKASSSSTNSKLIFQTTLNVATSSSVRMIETTSTTTMLEPSIAPAVHSDLSESLTGATTPPSSSITTLEPSRASTINSDLSSASSSSTPTEALVPTLLKTTHIPQRSTVQSITFSKGSIYSYRPRPGIVLDDTLDYTGAQGLSTHRPYGPPRHPPNPDTFDVVVSAIQGPGGSGTGEVKVPVNFGAHSGADDILTSPVEGQGFVSIDGQRTYLNLFDNTEGTAATGKVQPTRVHNAPIAGTGFAVTTEIAGVSTRPSVPIKRHRRPTQPPVRIDTCIVGDSSTCDASQHEACATVQGVSACHCKPGFARLTHSLPCKKIVSIVVSIRVDKIYDKKLIWTADLEDRDSEFHQTLVYEANRAIESAMSMTPFSDEYVGSSVNNIYQGDISQGQGGVFVNATLKLAYEPRTARQSLAGELQKQLLGVIQRRYNNIGNSALHVDSPAGSISNLQDLDECASSELNDCHSSATCTNTFGGFTCSCRLGLKDPHKSDQSTSGRTCLSCASSHCNNRGTCSYKDDQMHCTCTGNYYGAQCEIDGEVLGVAIGASVAALIIIALTLVCLVMWSRKWSQEQKAISPVYGYVQGTLPGTLPGSMGTLASVKQGPPTNLPSYMWAQVADHLATANVYATEPMGPTRPSSAMIGYPTLSLHGTLPPVPLPRLQAPPHTVNRQRHQPEPDSSDSEPQDKDRADLIPQSNFQVPRPKSRSSLANQSGIYYDVEYDQGDARHLSKNNIPMSTYSMAPFYRT